MFTGIITHIGTVRDIRKTGDWIFTIAAPGFTRGIKLGASVACSGACLTVIKKDASSFTVQTSAETLSRTMLGGWKKGTHLNLERALKVGDELGGHFVSGHVDGLAYLEDIESSGESKVMLFKCQPSLRDTTKKILDSLTPGEQNVLRMRFGIGMNTDHTLEEVEQQFSVTRERIRQIEAKALRKLGKKTEQEILPRHPHESGDLKPQKDSHLRGNDNLPLSRFIAPKGSVTLDGVSLTVNEVKGEHFTVNIIPHTLAQTTLNERKKGDMLNLEIDLIARYLARMREG